MGHSDLDEIRTSDARKPSRSPARRVIGFLLWTSTAFQAFYVGRWFLLAFLYALTGDNDPESIIQLGHPNWRNVIWPAMLLPSQGPELAVLILLILGLVVFRWYGRLRASPSASS